MKINELIELAAKKTQGQKNVAAELGVQMSRLSEWKAGIGKPKTGQIGLLAEIAGLPVMETIAAVEGEINSDFAGLWERTLKKMKAAGVTACTTIALGICSMTAPTDALAAIGGNGRKRA